VPPRPAKATAAGQPDQAETTDFSPVRRRRLVAVLAAVAVAVVGMAVTGVGAALALRQGGSAPATNAGPAAPEAAHVTTLLVMEPAPPAPPVAEPQPAKPTPTQKTSRRATAKAVKEPPPTLWADFPEPIIHKEIAFGVQSARVDNLALRIAGGPGAGAQARSVEKFLLVTVFIENRARTWDFYYRHPTQVSLADEVGRPFRLCQDPAGVARAESTVQGDWKVAGLSRALLVRPGQRLTDLLVFEPGQLGEGKKLLLEMSGELWDDQRGQNHMGGWPARIGFRLDQAIVTHGAGPTATAPSTASGGDGASTKSTPSRKAGQRSGRVGQ
jgi:hypothetical protein